MGKNDKQKSQNLTQKSVQKATQPIKKEKTRNIASTNVNKISNNKHSKASVSQVVSKQSTANANKSIDDLFTKLAKSQKEKKVKDEQDKVKIEKLREARKKIKSEESKYKTDEYGIRYTEEGYRIYTVEELKIGKGGETKDCPFDCNCCF